MFERLTPGEYPARRAACLDSAKLFGVKSLRFMIMMLLINMMMVVLMLMVFLVREVSSAMLEEKGGELTEEVQRRVRLDLIKFSYKVGKSYIF